MSDQSVPTPPIRSDGLQLEEHRRLQEKQWTTERIAWICFGLIVVVALLGFTGSGGYFSRATALLEGGSIEFPRIARWVAEDSFRITFEPGEAQRALTLSPAFARTFQIEDIQPEPTETQARPDGERLIFNLVEDAPAVVHIHVRAQKPGLAAFNATIDDGARKRLTSIVLP